MGHPLLFKVNSLSLLQVIAEAVHERVNGAGILGRADIHDVVRSNQHLIGKLISLGAEPQAGEIEDQPA
jgi:hypothetical protein